MTHHRYRSQLLISLLGLLGLAACKSGPAEAEAQAQAQAQAEAEAERAPPAAELAPDAQAPAPSVAAVAGAPEPASDPATPGAPEPAAASSSELHLAARGSTHVGLHTLVDGRLVVAVGPQLMLVEPDGSFRPDPKMLAGIVHPREPGEDNLIGLNRWYTLSAGGRWPDDLVLTTTLESGFRGESDTPVVHRRAEGQWQVMSTRSKHYEWGANEIHPWIEGSLLTRRSYDPYYRGQEEWEGERGPSEAQMRTARQGIERARTLVVIRGVPKAPELGARRVATFKSWTNGDILLVTRDAHPDLVIAGPEGERSHVALPVASERELVIHGVEASAVGDAWIYGRDVAGEAGEDRAYLARWAQGAATRIDAPPCEEGVASFVVMADGTQWATCGPSLHERYSVAGAPGLWRKPVDGAWIRERVPADWGEPRQVAKLGEELWLATQHSIARSGTPKQVLELPELAVISSQVFEFGPPVPVGGYCDYALITLPTAPSEAASAKAALDRVLAKAKFEGYISLVKVTIRGVELLGVQVSGANDKSIPPIEAAVRAALGEGVGDALCYWSEVDDDDTIATWELDD
ncbi:hypothetical protein ENSA5_24000 [Enhygromyxa salina]|uniref:Lipoprotein n=1 Tax=Enhygromyxa salina TaxID=215803 RepID=A0A2S9YB62_9BACT|nr:hypothetical protein [Enhygromyxa salina]PRQ02345.1 hypothetical protein ENSA5_24000 [Enhygromyxa salina]